MNRALLVGINAYPGNELSGCVNDITDMANFLVERCHFASSQVRLLTDGRATTDAIVKRLEWLVSGAKKGDRLFFHYSGHGAQVASRDPKSQEVDGLDEVICPVDFDWSDARMVRDNDFARIFGKLPKGVEFVWVSDSCHSGDLWREMPVPNAPVSKPKRLLPPADLAWRVRVAHDSSIKARPLLSSVPALNGALISGCRSNQTSSDASFNNRPNGALTYYLLRALEAPQGLREPLSDVVPALRSALRRGGYSQVPQIEGSGTVTSQPFLAKL